MTILPLLLALCGEPSPAATPTNPVPIPPRAEHLATPTNAPPPIKLQSAPAPLPPAPPPKRKLAYILPDVWAVQTSPGVIYLCIPEHNFHDLAKLFPTNTTHLEGVQVWREEP